MEVLLVENNHFVLARPPEELLARAFGEALDQDLELLAHVAQVALLRKLVLEVDHPLEALDFHLLGHVVGQVLGRVRPWALGVLEHVGAVVAHLAHERQRFFKILLRLGVEAAEEVGRDRTVREDAPDGGDAVEIPLAGVFAVHNPEDTRAAGLRREVDVTAKVRVRGHDAEGFVAHILRVGSYEADAHLGDGLGDALQEFGEIHPVAAVALEEIGVHILPEERNLAEALVAHVAYFL